MMFELDAFASFVAVLAGALLMISSVSGSFLQTASSYSAESERLALLQASEAVITTSGGAGLAMYEQNSLRHHELDPEKVRRVSGLGPETVAHLLGLKGKASVEVDCDERQQAAEATSVNRLAYLMGEVCVVTVSNWE